MKMFSLPPIQGTYGREIANTGVHIRQELMQFYGGNFWEMPPCPHEGCPEDLFIVRGFPDVGGTPPVMCARHGNAGFITFLIEEAECWTVGLTLRAPYEGGEL